MIQLPSVAWTEMTPDLISKFGEIVNTMPQVTSILNLPALVVTIAVTLLLYIGIKESAKVNATLVIVKLVLIGLFLWFGLPHFNPSEHWKDFAPNGWQGIMTGAAPRLSVRISRAKL
ncbi:amino acid permease [Maribacter flavus]|uniref:Amino acid permease n=1 Tax=Maribacter flavus TaxID=1658664 RepID=A0A5B2TS55_9FLAO|nr:amino acid permease [Maribacter flavus]KAA2217426.1 amino acid permease [Maribacter flavus]